VIIEEINWWFISLWKQCQKDSWRVYLFISNLYFHRWCLV